MIYTTECLQCGAPSERSYSFAEWDELEAHPDLGNKLMGVCEVCHKGKIIQTLMSCPEVISYGEVEVKSPAFNIADGVRSPAQQEATYAKVIKKHRKAASDTRAARRGTKRADGEMRHIGTIPRELYISMINQSGNRRYWDQGDSKKTLKRHGLLYDT